MDSPSEGEEISCPPKKSLAQTYQDYVDKEKQQNEVAVSSGLASDMLNIRREITLFESSGNRGHYLEKIYTALLSVPPTSVEGVLSFKWTSFILG